MVSSTTLAGVIMIIIIIITGTNATITPEDSEYEINEGDGMVLVSICLNVTADSNTNEPFEITVDTSAIYAMGVAAMMGSGIWNIVCSQFSVIAKTCFYSFCLT